MELVYLWVEDYKNIKKQGFNFSPRFECIFHDKYDENSKLLDNCELEIKPKEHIENFFGENINVTAIVGKNGSGKTRLLNYLDTPYKDENNKIWIYKKEDKYYYFHSYRQLDIKLISNNLDIQFTYDDFSNPTEWIALDKSIGENSLPFLYMDGIGNLHSHSIHRKNDYNMAQNSLFIPKYIRVNIEHSNLFYSLTSSFHFDILRLILRNNSTKYLSNFVNQEVNDYRDRYSVSTVEKNQILIYEKNKTVEHTIASNRNFHNKEIVFYDRNRERMVGVVQEIEELHRQQTPSKNYNVRPFQGTNKFLEFELALLIAFIENYLKRCQLYISSEFLCHELEELKNEISAKMEIRLKDKTIYRIRENYMTNFLKKLATKYNFDIFSYPFSLDELIVATEYINSLHVHYNEDNPYIDIPINSEMKKNIKNIAMFQKVFQDNDMFMAKQEPYLRVFELDMLNSQTQAKYGTISDGEKQFLKFSVDLISLFEDTYDNQTIMILVDEIDNHLHPLWKKRVLLETIEIFEQVLLNNEKNVNIHMLFSTHSPFLLSDMPKQNIVFLDTYNEKDNEVENEEQKIGNCKVLKYNQVLAKKQTFGANIHTLLSDSFFMEDGLMGEFAKQKINEIIDFFKEENEIYNNDKENLLKIINSIGEPFLKEKLLSMYNEKYPKSKQEKIAELEAEIQRLKTHD